jgi:hypothetical protein
MRRASSRGNAGVHVGPACCWSSIRHCTAAPLHRVSALPPPSLRVHLCLSNTPRKRQRSRTLASTCLPLPHMIDKCARQQKPAYTRRTRSHTDTLSVVISLVDAEVLQQPEKHAHTCTHAHAQAHTLHTRTCTYAYTCTHKMRSQTYAYTPTYTYVHVHTTHT